MAEQAADVPEQRTAEGAKIGQEGKVLKKRRVTRKVEKKNKRGFACKFGGAKCNPLCS